MSLFGKIIKTGFDVVVATPVAIVKDVVTLGGVVTGKIKTHTAEQLKAVDKDLKEVREELEKM